MEWVRKNSDRRDRSVNTVRVNAITGGRYNIYIFKEFLDRIMLPYTVRADVGYEESAIYLRVSEKGYKLSEQRYGKALTITVNNKGITYDISGDYEYAGKSDGVMKFVKKARPGITFIEKGARHDHL